MAKHFKEETGLSHPYILIGEIIVHYKRRNAKILVSFFSVIGIILFLAGFIFVFIEDSIDWQITLIIMGIVIVGLSLGIYFPQDHKYRDMNFAVVGEKRFNEDISSLEQKFYKTEKKKQGYVNNFKNFSEWTDNLVFLSKHMSDVKYAGVDSYIVTIDSDITCYLSLNLSKYCDFITNHYLNHHLD